MIESEKQILSAYIDINAQLPDEQKYPEYKIKLLQFINRCTKCGEFYR